jgi:hypothetical protein
MARVKAGDGKLTRAAAVSVALHAALVGLARLPSPAEAHERPRDEPSDVWVGTTSELASERLIPVDVGAPAAGVATLGEAAPSATPAPPPVEATPPVPSEIPRTPESSPIRRSRDRAPEPPPAARAGEATHAAATHDAATRDEPTRDEATRAPDRERPARRPRHSRAAASAASVASEAGEASAAPPVGASPGGAFGAEGPGGARDLGRAFTRAIPPACQADPLWGDLPAGAAGSALFAIDVDADGKIARFEPLDRDPPKHLVALVRRTTALLGAGTFAIRLGSVTGGRQTLRVRASLSDEGEDAVGLSFKYEGGHGLAAFTQSAGRRVEVDVEVVRVEVHEAPAELAE